MRRALPHLVLAATACALVLTTTGAGAKSIAGQRIPIVTAKGAGGLALGRPIAALRAEGLIAAPRRGCELARGERIAPLRAPLEGTATFFPKDRLSAITVTGGATTGAGIEIGDSLGKARKAYPGAPFDDVQQNKPFPVGLLWIGGRAAPKLTLVITPGGDVDEITVPRPTFCE